MTDEAPTIEEQYSSATNASNLRVEMDSDRRSNADILMAAAWAPSRLGSALLRLHSEFDATGKPRRMADDSIDRLALSLDKGQFPLVLSEKGVTEHQKRRDIEANAIAEEWYRHEVKLQFGRLKSLPEVRHQLTMQADKWGMFPPEDVASGVLLWWLDRVCKSCHGVKFQVIGGTPSLSTKLCKTCRGTGEAHLPCLDEGRRLAAHIDWCIGEARHSIKKRLRNRQM